MGKRLFGTDGIRGAVGVYPLDTATVYRLGSALTRLLTERGGRGRVVIGSDFDSALPGGVGEPFGFGG